MAAFGNMLKEWREIRRFSQLQLAMEAEMSARHLSFLESGRANPSKAMVLRLSQALEMPRSVINQAMHCAGFAPVFGDSPSTAPQLLPVRRAVDMTLASHDPFPGVVVNRHWNIVSANQAGAMLMALTASDAQPNLMELLIAAANQNLIENWEEVAMLSLMRLRSEINDLGGDEILSAMVGRLPGHHRLQASSITQINLDQAVIPTILRLGDVRVSLFSAIAAFGSVQNVRAGELRIELMFPLDEATDAWFRQKSI